MGESQDIEGAQSVIEYFRTLEFTPTQPAEITVTNVTPQEVVINWKEPESPNGIIDHYEILMELRRIDEKRIMQRPFCDSGYEIPDQSQYKKIDHMAPDNLDNKQDTDEELNGSCSCKNCPGVDQTVDNPDADRISNEKAKHNEENEFVNDLLDVIWTLPSNPFEQSDIIGDVQQDRKKREIASDSDNKVGHQIKNQSTPAITAKSEEDTFKESLKEVLKPQTREVYTRVFKKVNSSVTTLTVNNLKHFGQYSLKIRACHKLVDQQEKYQECSEYANEEVQTQPDKQADNIEGGLRIVGNDDTKPKKVTGEVKNESLIDTIDNSPENKEETVFITWNPPKDPNLLIVNYQIKYIFGDRESDLETCEPAKKLNATNYR